MLLTSVFSFNSACPAVAKYSLNLYFSRKDLKGKSSPFDIWTPWTSRISGSLARASQRLISSVPLQVHGTPIKNSEYEPTLAFFTGRKGGAQIRDGVHCILIFP